MIDTVTAGYELSWVAHGAEEQPAGSPVSVTLYVKLSVPLKLEAGVYKTDAESTFGEPATQAAFERAPKDPCDGPETIEKESWHVSMSEPDRPTVVDASSLVVADAALATDLSFTGLTVIVKVWTARVSPPPLAIPPSSWIWTETVAEPLALAAGV